MKSVPTSSPSREPLTATGYVPPQVPAPPSAERLRTLLEHLPGGAAFVLDRELRYELANGEALRAVGTQPADFVGKTIFEVLDAETAAAYEPQFRTALGGQPFTYEHTVGDHWFQSRGIPLRAADGEVDAVAVVSYDITERRRNEERLRLAETNQRAILDSARQSIMLIAPDYSLLQFNQYAASAASAVYGQTMQPGQSMLDYVTDDQRAEFTGHFQRALTGEEISVEKQIKGLTGSGWWEFFYYPIRQPDGQVGGVTFTARDITARKQTEEGLRRSEERFRTLVQNLPDYAIFRIDPTGIITEWTEGAQRIKGYTAGEVVGQSIALFYTPEGLATNELTGELAQAVRCGRAEREGLRVRKGGERFWVNEIATAIYDADGGLVGFTKISRDITERKQAEQRQAFLLSLSDALIPLSDPVAIEATVTCFAMNYFEADRCYYCQIRAGEAIINRDAARPGLPSVAGVYALADLPILNAVVEAGQPVVVQDARTSERLDASLRHRCRQMEIGSLVEIPLIRQGQPVGILCITQRTARHWSDFEIGLAREIAERTWLAVERARAETALRESEKRLRLAIEATEMGTWEWNLETNDVYWNEPHFRLFGLEPTPGPLTPELFIHHIHPDELHRVTALLQKAIAERSVYDTEFRALREDGSQRWMSGYGRIVEEADGRPIRMSGVMYDVDKRRQAEEALRETDRRKDEFLAMLAHELRNPLAPIRNMLQMLQLTVDAEGTVASAVSLMNRQVEHLVRLVDDLLDVSRISRGKIDLRRERFDLTTVVRQAVEAACPLYEAGGRRLSVALPTVPLYLHGDATRLTQVVSNLLTNGLRYTGANGQVWITLSVAGDRAELRVRDNGIGLAPDQLVPIFELFVQVDNSLARSQGGLGLGLTLVKKLVEMHGGQVEARSDGLGRGSEFIVQLPLLPESIPTMNTTKSSKLMATPGYRILVVDDNRDAADTLSMLLKLSRNDVHTRYGGRDAIAAIGSLRPEVVLLDIGMPELDGYDTCYQIRQLPGGDALVLIAVTGYGQEEDKRRSIEAGFDAHLTKPVDLAVLKALLNELLPQA